MIPGTRVAPAVGTPAGGAPAPPAIATGDATVNVEGGCVTPKELFALRLTAVSGVKSLNSPNNEALAWTMDLGGGGGPRGPSLLEVEVIQRWLRIFSSGMRALGLIFRQALIRSRQSALTLVLKVMFALQICSSVSKGMSPHTMS